MSPIAGRDRDWSFDLVANSLQRRKVDRPEGTGVHQLCAKDQ